MTFHDSFLCYRICTTAHEIRLDIVSYTKNASDFVQCNLNECFKKY